MEFLQISFQKMFASHGNTILNIMSRLKFSNDDYLLINLGTVNQIFLRMRDLGIPTNLIVLQI
jgi:hypothetical protein